MDNELQGERDHQDQGSQAEESELDFEVENLVLEEDRGIDWESWWQIIVHRNRGVQEAEPPEYPDEAWSLDDKEAPFPFNLNETWYCAALLMLIILVHSELDTEWLLQHGYRRYLLRISFRIILTVAISFLSTLAFEIIGNILDLAREVIIDVISLQIKALFVERLGWGPVDDEGRADWENGVPFYHDTAYFHQPIIEMVSGITILTFHYVVAVKMSYIRLIVGSAVIELTKLVSVDLAKFIAGLPSYFALPRPEMNDSFGARALLWEYGVPSFIQVWTAAFLYLSVFLFMSRAEKPIILGLGGQDPFSKLAFQLLRATAMHLLAYTAYQIACSCVIVAQALLFRFGIYNLYDSSLGHIFMKKINIELCLGSGLWIMVAHWVVKSACRWFVAICWPLWVSYIAWLSIKTEQSTWQNWIVYGSLLDNDMNILDPDKRVVSRAMMTTLCGLKSSWPARMRLSTGDNVD
ncbi:hypothetical protein F5Y00DRAFT_264917 [Daldinia vernicosa]|uniref:uncharacterized protein n=1 Tax=Daldinia vernicosa TaxID=114800 RepID=UPI0020083601|nr:uncharacterized protein F5Y00DRAFT_264917 [Daldinia vernicosa]KAI0846022.1 hypothetical protein F5Y00DRAFT_264917 [Daldinia vernicosa]